MDQNNTLPLLVSALAKHAASAAVAEAVCGALQLVVATRDQADVFSRVGGVAPLVKVLSLHVANMISVVEKI